MVYFQVGVYKNKKARESLRRLPPLNTNFTKTTQ
ncbi:MAG: hypothetical protein H6Q14_1711 [Bacteroidetes bacterium]|jgi:hypothetical protein|nr:hypothetical protein [Bacteroidota bacterium]